MRRLFCTDHVANAYRQLTDVLVLADGSEVAVEVGNSARMASYDEADSVAVPKGTQQESKQVDIFGHLNVVSVHKTNGCSNAYLYPALNQGQF